MKTEEDRIPNSDKVKDQLLKDIEKAERVQKQMRKDAPKIGVSRIYTDPRDSFVRRLVPDAFWSGDPTSDVGQGRKGSVPPTKSTYFDRPEKHRENISKGYTPVLEEGQHAQQSGDLLYWRPIEFQQDAMREASLRSQERINADMDEQAKKDGLMQDATKTISKITDGSDERMG